MRTHREVLVILVIFVQVVIPAPLNADNKNTSIVPYKTMKARYKTHQENITNRTIRKFGFHVQIICGIDSFEDDYYGCEEAPVINLKDDYKNSELNVIQHSSYTANKRNTASEPTRRAHTETQPTFHSSAVSHSSRYFRSSRSSTSSFRSTTLSSRHISTLHTSRQHAVRSTPAKNNTRLSTIKTNEARYLAKKHITTTSSHMQYSINYVHEEPKQKKTKITTTQKTTAKTTSDNLESKSDTPRCLEKTIDPKKLTSEPSTESAAPTTSTGIIWVGNTPPKTLN